MGLFLKIIFLWIGFWQEEDMMTRDTLRGEYDKKKSMIESRLKEFGLVKGGDLFYELCFCILTPQSKGRRADIAIQELKKRDFWKKDVDPLPFLEKNIRFHHTKAARLLEVKKGYNKVKKGMDNLGSVEEKRLFLINRVKGFGPKEASHYLRNVGYRNLAILDRHILKNLKALNVIEEIPRHLSLKQYLEIECRFREFSREVNIDIDHLDLLFWSEETGEVFK